MKNTHCFLIIIILTIALVNCDQSRRTKSGQNEFKSLDSSYIRNLIPNSSDFKEGIFLTSKEKAEIDFLKYLNYYHTFFYIDFENKKLYQKLYVSKLFSTKNNSVTIKHYRKIENNEYEKIYKYKFNSNNQVAEISDVDFKYNSIKFHYDNKNQISKILIPSTSIALKQIDNHHIRNLPITRYIKSLKYNYSKQRLLTEITEEDGKKQIEKKFYRFTKQGTPLSYIKIIDSKISFNSFMNESEYIIIGFKNEYPCFIAQFSKESVFGEFSINPNEIALISYDLPNITIKKYYKSFSTNEMELRLISEVKRSIDYKIENVKTIKILSKNVEEYRYEYHYSINDLLGFNLFVREYDYHNNKDKNEAIKYELEEYFHKIN